MKLRNFMYATMIACAFASCSKDEVIEGGQEPAKGDASLTISVGAKATKGVITTGDVETTVNNINIFLCNADGSVKEHVYLADNIVAEKTVTFNDLKEGDILHCVGYANFGENMSVIPATKSLTVDANAISGTNLPMHGLSDAVTIHAGENTATINLVRDLARVELTKVTLDMGRKEQTEFTAGTFNFDFVSASINSAPSSSIVTLATSATPDNRTYAVGSTFVGGLGSSWAWSNTTNTGSAVTSYIKADQVVNNATYIMGTTNEEQTVTIPENIVFYVLPNQAIKENEKYTNAHPTALTLFGTMGIAGATRANGQVVTSSTIDGYYNIEIGQTGSVTGQEAGAGILPNKSYTIELIVVGTGGGIGGDRPFLVVNTLVKAWDSVKQITPVK